MMNRRRFLKNATGTGAAMFASLRPDSTAFALNAVSAHANGVSPEVTAQNESFWAEIRKAFSLDPGFINLNAGISPSPRAVQDILKRDLDFSNRAPVHNMESIQEPKIEGVRIALAKEFGCDPEELAITRNATEALQTVQMGIDLSEGDEVVSTAQDYWAMWNAWDQRERRDRIKYIEVELNDPPISTGDILQKIEQSFTDKTKLLLISHIAYLNGQIFPVKEICQMARKRGIRTVVDGAHAFAHLPFRISELGCDYYATSLHKWLMAPVGSGFLYVRRELIPSLWPLLPAYWEKFNNDIRKFEQVGTHPAATHNAIAEAMRFHLQIGIERKTARLQYLKERWSRHFEKDPRIKFCTDLDKKNSCAIATMHIDGTDPEKVAKYLFERQRILVFPVKYEEFHGNQGIRVAPGVYTLSKEIDAFIGAIETVLKNPASVIN
jgi:selenocysteine lyase/cysteine desulfurase